VAEVFGASFMQHALAASVLVGGVCAYLGVYVVLRRIVFVGAALAQVSSAGVGAALALGVNPSGPALGATALGVALLSIRPASKRTTQESLIGVSYGLASAIAVLLVAKSAQGESHLLDVLSGNVLTVSGGQIALMAALAGLVALVAWLFGRRLLFVSFDPEMARTLGIRTWAWDLLFYVLLGLAISLSIRVAGALLVFSFLVIPPVTALVLTENLKKAFAVGIGASVMAAVLGLYLSFRFDLPSGPAIVGISSVLLAVAWVVGKLKR